MSFANMFDVLPKDDSDNEEAPKRLNKKQKRARDRRLRENEGATVVKDPYASKGPKKHHKAPRAGKREYDRKSGTGKQAFGGGSRRQGKGGRRTWKENEDETKDFDFNKEETEDGEGEGEEEEEEPGVTLEELGINLQTHVEDETIDIKNVKLGKKYTVKAKAKRTHNVQNKRNYDVAATALTGMSTIEGKQERPKRFPPQRRRNFDKKRRYDDEKETEEKKETEGAQTEKPTEEAKGEGETQKEETKAAEKPKGDWKKNEGFERKRRGRGGKYRGGRGGDRDGRGRGRGGRGRGGRGRGRGRGRGGRGGRGRGKPGMKAKDLKNDSLFPSLGGN